MIFIKAQTAMALGLINLIRVIYYRLSIKLKINPVRSIEYKLLDGDFYSPISHTQKTKPNSIQHNDTELFHFGWYSDSTSCPPQWHQNPFNKKNITNPQQPWWKVPDFDPNIGDIKTIWEASRFDWAIQYAIQTTDGNNQAINILNQWLISWCRHNPPYNGPNWKCGQEASIRIMHLAFASIILKQHKQATPALQALIKAHLQRIAPTIQYAIAQDNNHGTSEAAALFIGGSWLEILGEKDARRWTKTGRKWLENRAFKLIKPDGSFSQYSTNYHRVMLDTYSMAEYWRQTLGLTKFSPNLYQQLKKATNWLYQMVQEKSGDTPNLGANDGARLLPITNTDYRDFRPSIQLAMILFCQQLAFNTNQDSNLPSWNLPIYKLHINPPNVQAAPANSSFFPDGGYCTLRKDNIFALFRFPNFQFRPSQADALHVDLWINGVNTLRDGGTYSYNTTEKDLNYFGGTASHNTIQFDDQDQMPRLSRFLFGSWLKSKNTTPLHEANGLLKVSASYSDYENNFHNRELNLGSNYLKIIDSFKGFKNKAVLRWRLDPEKSWKITDKSITNRAQNITIHTDLPITRFELVRGWESRYYLQKTPLPVLEIEVQEPGKIITIVDFNT